jgi:Clostripain family
MPRRVNSSENEWTIMFFFASDNPLSPLLVSQVKAIKDAGFQEHTEVLVYFDPMERGVRSKIYNVNSKRKEKEDCKTQIGDGDDPFVRNMIEDEVSLRKLPAKIQKMMKAQDTVDARESLDNFVEFAISEHPARNYMLFLVGHGMIVGNDAFLPDDDPISAITLKQLRPILERFGKDGSSSLKLLGLHSCSMSSIEVAYELKGTADYMMATQGTAFVNGWPYRQLLKKTFKSIEDCKCAARTHAEKNKEDVELAVQNACVKLPLLMEKLYFLCLFNATDFMSLGYSADLVLCSLDPKKVQSTKKPIQDLVGQLKPHLTPGTSLVKDLVLLAHWESQSFWEENYTDLNDFCRCLSRRCTERADALAKAFAAGKPNGGNRRRVVKELRAIAENCDAVTKALDVIKSNIRAERFNSFVIQAENFGSEFQYSRGMSIFFPWNKPDDDRRVRASEKPDQPTIERRSRHVIADYANYDFTKEFRKDSWLSFLKLYFANTERDSRSKEDGDGAFQKLGDKAWNRARRLFLQGTLEPKRTPELKRTPEEGPDCTCPTIKNHPRGFSITPEALRAFGPRPKDKDTTKGE